MSDSPISHEDPVEHHLRQYGLRPGGGELDQVRSVLAEETVRERGEQGDGNAELMRLCCVQLFNAGLPETKAFLTAQAQVPEAEDVLEYLSACEASGDFGDFTVEAWAARYARYSGQE